MPRRWPWRQDRGRPLLREVHYAMGTLLDIQLYHEQPTAGLRLLRQACQEARRLEALFSRHLPASELSRLNARAGRGAMMISPELFEVLRAAQAWAQWSHGAFDPTAGALLTVWRTAASRGQAPSAEHLQAARRATGWSKLRLLPPRGAALMAAGMQLDLGGIAKGYAVDRMGRFLRQQGVQHALINFGESSLLAIGARPDGRPWPIAVRTLGGRVGSAAMAVRDGAVSTSASFGRVMLMTGRPLSHVIDPRHGRPLQHPAAVTVIAPTATAGEALSTALLVWTAGGEVIPSLPPGVSAYQMQQWEAVVPLRKGSDDATLRHARL
jgi:thiamine biosynthesis lipoprotein